MPALTLQNKFDLPPTTAQPSVQPIAAIETTVEAQATSLPPQSTPVPASIQTEFVFELLTGYVDSAGQVHRRGVMRLARTADEIEPMSDPRVQANPAYATVIILSRVMLSLGSLPAVSPVVIEGLFAGDLNYLQTFYRKINGLPQ